MFQHLLTVETLFMDQIHMLSSLGLIQGDLFLLFPSLINSLLVIG